MKFLLRTVSAAVIAGILAAPGMCRAEETNTAGEFREVYDLIRAHLAGETDKELNEAAVKGLLAQLYPRVRLLASDAGTNSAASGTLVASTTTFDGPIVYLRVGDVGAGLAEKLAAAYQSAATNKPMGVVLDLRFAGGTDYTAAADAAGDFLDKETPLLDWGQGMEKSKDNSSAITLPVAVLVNQQTSAAAEALAAVLRQNDRALILGSKTAGLAAMSEDYPLKDGARLRIATTAIKLGNGDTVSMTGVKPDVEVAVSTREERAYLVDPFRDLSGASSGSGSGLTARSNGAAGRNGRGRVSEADLIRERKADPGHDVDIAPGPTVRDSEIEKPVVHDPVLGRALDVIKAISSIRQSR